MIEYPDIIQMSPAWWSIRRGIPTASDMNRIVRGKDGLRSGSWAGYMGELLRSVTPLFDPGAMTEKPMNPALKHGIDSEPESREFYFYHTGRPVRVVGFCTTDCGRFGMSPDGLVVGEPGGLELKNPQPETQDRWLKKGTLPAEYKVQVHGQLVVGEGAIDYVDFLSYCRGKDPLLVRVERDDFTATVKTRLEEFWAEYTQLLSEVFGRPVRTAADVKRLIVGRAA